MSETIVQKKTAKLIQQELSDLLSFKLRYVSGALLTVSEVKVVPDLSLAKIFVSVLPDSRIPEVVQVLNKQSWEIRKELAARIRNKVRQVPELRFYEDDSFKEADRITRLLDDLVPPEDEDASPDPEAPQA